ncbi:MAG: CvpA family protein [Candidatus Binataceae bacterium]
MTTAGMNGLDYAILALIGVGAFSGLTRGALRMATSILSLVLGIYAASVYYGRAAAIAHKYLSTSPTVSAVIGYVAVFAIVFIAVEYAGATVVRLAHIIHLSWIDRLAGAVLGASIGAIIAGFVVLGMTAVLPPNPALLRDSRLAPQVLGYNQVLMAYVPPQVKKSFEEKRAELYRQWVLKAEGLKKNAGPEKVEDPESLPSPAK